MRDDEGPVASGEAASSQDWRGLVARAQSGDEEAWIVIYKSYYPRLFAVAAHRLGPDAAPDAVGETFARALRGIRRFRWRAGGFEPWIFRILENVVIDELRRRPRQPVTFDPLDPAAIDAAGRSALYGVSEPLGELSAREDLAALRRAFSRLSQEDQQLLILRVVAKLGAVDVARVLGKSPGAVRTAQSRAIGRLREIYRQTSPSEAPPPVSEVEETPRLPRSTLREVGDSKR